MSQISGMSRADDNIWSEFADQPEIAQSQTKNEASELLVPE
jgi:hypothetical protein